MEAYVLDIRNRERGSLLQNKTFVPLDGPIFSVSNSLHNKPVRFVHAAWDPTGRRIAAGDCHGNIYALCLEKNRFELVARLKVCSSCVVFASSKSVLVALADCTIVCLNLDSKCVENQFSHHTSSVTHISFSKSGATVLSCCKNRAILWSLGTFDVLRILTLKQDVDIVKVFFLPQRDVIVSAFNDNSVFLWDFKKFNCIAQFLCESGGCYLNVRTVSASRDEQLIACAGRASWFLVWSVEAKGQLGTVSLPGQATVRQVDFLPNFRDEHILSVLTAEGEMYIYNLKSLEIVYKLAGMDGKIVSLANSRNLHQTLVLSFRGKMELYDVEDVLSAKDMKTANVSSRRLKADPKLTKKLQDTTKADKNEKSTFEFDKRKLLSIIKQYEEFPDQHRTFIWSRLLSLPHNVDSFGILHQASLKEEPFTRECPSAGSGTRVAFSKLMSLLVCWHPVLKEINYMQSVTLPFIKVLHKNIILCFEILISLISNWCHSWFLFCPFPPFNVLCVVENILSYHDRELMAHFLTHSISSEVYAWCLLKTSFSEVFSRSEWLKLWDNIFANPLSFQLYAVAAFNIAMRNVLLQCKTEKEFKDCFKKHSISASTLLQKAYHLQKTSPENVDPEPVVGTFRPIPRGTYPTLFEMSQMKIQLQTATRKRIIDEEIDYLQQREGHLGAATTYLKELQELQLMRRKLLIQSADLKDAAAIEALEKKLRSTQTLIQGNLSDQAFMLKETVGMDMFSNHKEDFKKQYFKFQEYANKLRKKIY